MSVLVTGGAGFIGSHLVERLVGRGDRVVCLDNFDDFYPPEVKRANIAAALDGGLCELVEGDIRDADLCARLLRRGDVEAVVHLAARAGVRPSIEQPALYQEVNCTGTLNLLEAVRHGRPVRRFLFGSSSSVYGVNSKVPFSEDDPVGRPISPYAATKRAGELLCHVYQHLYGVPIVCLRLFTVYGPRQRPDLAIHKFARLIDADGPIPAYGDGTSRRDYTFVSDIVDGIVAALDVPEGRLGWQIINLRNSEPVALRALITLLEGGLGKQAQVLWLPEQPGDVPVTCADISRARELLGYAPSYPIRQGIAEFVEWFRGAAHP